MTKILFVDDLEQNRYLLRTLLTAHGYDMLEASNGVEALDLARREHPDLILSDILMPQMDGFTLCRECKRDEALRAIPFVFYTATYTDPRDEQFALKLGAARFVVKPIENGQFLAILGEVLGEYQSGELAESLPPMEEETAFYRLYNEALIRKLEDKMLALEQSHRALAESEERLRRLASGVAHELRNPLGVIHNAVYYLRMTAPPIPQHKEFNDYLRILETETRSAVNIVSNLLAYTTDALPDRKPVPVTEVVRRALERYPAPANIRLRLDLPPDLPPLHVDAAHIEQALGNLVINAYEAMPGGGELSIASELPLNAEHCLLITEHCLLITVQDTGPGIPPEALDKLFEPLFTTKPHGLGLGLPVSKKLAEINGGRLEVHSAPGQGARFSLVLPAATA